MLFNKQKRIKYLGFDDFWFMAIGLIVVSLIIDFIFNNSFRSYPLGIALINWGISFGFTLFNWFITRSIMIELRKRLPRFKDTKQRLFFVVLFIATTILLIDLLGGLFLAQLFGDSYNPIDRTKVLMVVSIIAGMTVAIYEAIYFYVRLKQAIREEEQANQAMVQAELQALRNQAQPHFLFNSLNTLRDIIDQNPKEDAKEFVDKLSNVYRFILESGNAHLTPLSEELRFAQSYIHIQSERFGDNLTVNWEISDEALNKMVVPMSLQLLLENAIKHNVISRLKPLTIQVNAGNGLLSIENKLQPKSTTLPSTKLGLKNIAKRYDLLSEQSIVIDENGQRFLVQLPLLQPSDQKVHHADTHH